MSRALYRFAQSGENIQKEILFWTALGKVNSGPPNLSSLSHFFPTLAKEMYGDTPSRGFCEMSLVVRPQPSTCCYIKELEAKWITYTLADACNNQWGRQMLKTLLSQNAIQPLCAFPALPPQLLLIQQSGPSLSEPVLCHLVLTPAARLTVGPQMLHGITAEHTGSHRGKDFRSTCDVKSEHHLLPSGVLNIPTFYYVPSYIAISRAVCISP